MASDPAQVPKSIRFGDDFELNPRAYQLLRSGRPLKLERIPMEILLLLTEHRGQLVSREQIAERIWGKGHYLDTDNSINGAVRKIRHVLGTIPSSLASFRPSLGGATVSLLRCVRPRESTPRGCVRSSASEVPPSRPRPHTRVLACAGRDAVAPPCLGSRCVGRVVSFADAETLRGQGDARRPPVSEPHR